VSSPWHDDRCKLRLPTVHRLECSPRDFYISYDHVAAAAEGLTTAALILVSFLLSDTYHPLKTIGYISDHWFKIHVTKDSLSGNESVELSV